jgi:hypothetical protein
MMLKRLIGSFVALVLAVFAMIGILALIGTDLWGAYWQSDLGTGASVQRLSALPAAPLRESENITFFSSEYVAEHDLTVSTGIRYAQPEDLANGQPESSWCYIRKELAGKLTRSVELMQRTGLEPPSLSNFDEVNPDELALIGLDRPQLAILARDYCRFQNKPGGRS